MAKPELLAVSWLAPSDIAERATHRFGKCSECGDTIAVERANPINETDGALYRAFREHVRLKHKEDSSGASAGNFRVTS